MFDGQISEWRPNICQNGHRLIKGNTLVAWMPCSCWEGRSGHRTVECRECGAIWYSPPHVDDCDSAVYWK